MIESHKHSLNDILKESLEHEKSQIDNLYDLLKLVDGKSVYPEEYALEMIVDEETHISEVQKMLRVQPK